MNPLSSFVDKIYCINLDSRVDRWKSVTDQFEQVGLLEHVTRVSAIVEDDPREGCLKSHIHCVADAMRNNCKNILIFEDDVYFLQFSPELLSGVLQYLEQDQRWDLFYLGGNVMYPARFVRKHLFRSRFFSTHAYIINSRAFEKVLEAAIPIDKWYAWNTRSYGLYPMIATQAETYSDIRGKMIPNLTESFNRKYELLVEPNIILRWLNYMKTHYLK